MRNFQKKKSFKDVMQTKPALIFLAILVIVFAWSAIGLVGKAKETAKNKNIAQNKITELQEQKIKLEADIEKLNTDEGIEESIRDKFGWAKEGEQMIVVVDEKIQPEAETQNNQKGFFNFLKNLFR